VRLQQVIAEMELDGAELAQVSCCLCFIPLFVLLTTRLCPVFDSCKLP
jgi:hypothetical protein